MSVINYVTGYHGFTTEPGYGENNGYVKKCIVAIEFPYQGNDVDFFISTGTSDWGAKMGDGSIIPLSSPVIIAVGKNNAFVQFDMSTGYPSNSPLFLVYRSDTAGMKTTARDTNRSFTASANSATGKFAFTSEPGSGPNGYTTKCIATFNFPLQPDEPAFNITTDASHWGLRVGNGTLINLSNPKVLSINREAAVVEFTMATAYPSNSPGIIIIRNSAARYTIVPTAIHEYVAVTNITSPSGSSVLGDLIDLSSCGVEPYNATYKEITWTVVSGSGSIIDNAYAQGSAVGTLKIRGTVKNKSNNTIDYSKDFNITITNNTIRIQKQPDSDVTIESGKSGEINITAFADSKVIEYQWYVNTTKSTSGATAIAGATSDELTISSSVGGGVHYFFCKVSAPCTTAVYSIISKVTINVLPSGMSIIPSNPLLLQAKEVQLSIDWVPSDVTDTAVLWKSSNTDVATVDTTNGLLRTFSLGTTKITATRMDGKMSATTNVTVQGYKSVTNITDVPTSVYVGEILTLTGTVVPTDAVAKTITWSILKNNADATLTGNRLICNDSGTVIVRATIAGGKNENESYTKDFTVNCNVRFIPITDISLLNDMSSAYEIGSEIIVDHKLTPENSTENEIEWSIISGDGQISSNILIPNEIGSIKIRATVIGGKGTNEERLDFIKDFTFTNITQKFIPVDNISVETRNTEGNSTNIYDLVNSTDENISYDKGSISIFIDPIIEPNNATNKTWLTCIEEIKYGTTNSDSDSVYDVKSWDTLDNDTIKYTNNNHILTIYTDRLTDRYFYKVIFKFTIKNGLSKTEDYTQSIEIILKYFTNETAEYKPLEDINIIYPSVLRAYTPILLTRYTSSPTNATIREKNNGRIPDSSIIFKFIRESDDKNIMFMSAVGSTVNMIPTIEPLKIFDLKLPQLYFYPFTPGKLKINITVKNSTVEDTDNFNRWNPDIIDLVKEDEIEILDPFISVKNILNIPENIKVGDTIVLSPEIDTEGGLLCYNPYWDDEIATNTNIIWTIDSDTADSTLIDGILNVSKAGSVVLKATIDSGEDEELIWYDYTPNDNTVQKYLNLDKDIWGRAWNNETKSYENPIIVNVGTETDPIYVSRNTRADYIKKFTITVTNDDKIKSVLPFLTITLIDGTTIDIDTIEDLTWIMNSQPDDFLIILNDVSFRKNEITGFEFYDITKVVEKPPVDIVEPIMPEEPIAPIEPTEPVKEIISNIVVRQRFKSIINNMHLSMNENYMVEAYKLLNGEIGVGPDFVLTEVRSVIFEFFTSRFDTLEEAEEWYNNRQDDPAWDAFSTGRFPGTEYVDILNMYNEYAEKYFDAVYYDQIDAYETALDEYDIAMEKYDKDYAQYQIDLEEYNKKKEEYDDIISSYDPDEYNNHEAMKSFFNNYITSLKNFGRNCTSLISFNSDTMMIPPSVHGDRCLENFLMGCTSFNQKLIYNPYEVDENTYGMFKYFLRDCISFNSDIEINIDEINNGESAFHGFLYGCTSFNKELTVFPTKLYGKASMKRFMYNCTKFNQNIHIPSNLSGYQCLMEFMEKCVEFNKDFILPDDVGNEGMELCNMMKNCHNMCSVITIPLKTGINGQVSEQTLSSTIKSSILSTNGVTIAGDGAEDFLNKVGNSYENGPWPYTHFTNLDGLYD